MCVSFVTSFEKLIQLPLQRDADFTDEEKAQLRKAWPVIREPFDNSGTLPTYGKCIQLKAEIEWECQRAIGSFPEVPAEPSPGAAPAESGGSSTCTAGVDVAIVIALEEEFRELFAEIGSRCQAVDDQSTGRSFYSFEQPSSDPKRPYRCVATFIGQMGHPKAALVTEKLVSSWSPATVVMLGIAGGIDKDLSVGDVVVPSTVDSYADRGKAVPAKRRKGFNIQFAGEVYRCSPDLINRLQHFEFSKAEAHARWLQTCAAHLQSLVPQHQREQLAEAKLLRRTVALRTGHIASGPFVGAAKPFLDWLKGRDRTYLALDMEAGGLMAAVSEKVDLTRTLILRGISDYGDERKAELDKVRDGALRRYAMRNTFSLLWALLESDCLPR
jgi:nucleoside phosphorylase